MLEELLRFKKLALSENHQEEHRMIEERGELAQIINSECFRHLVYLELKTGFHRGKHYHLKRKEIFYVVSGKVKAVFEDIETR